jgi:hypothetical protein
MIGRGLAVFVALILASSAVEAAQTRCKGEGERRSLNSNVATTIDFRNESAGRIRIYWLDFSGRRVFYAVLGPGQGYRQQTYLTHPWVAVGATGACRGPFMPKRRGSVVRIE